VGQSFHSTVQLLVFSLRPSFLSQQRTAQRRRRFPIPARTRNLLGLTPRSGTPVFHAARVHDFFQDSLFFFLFTRPCTNFFPSPHPLFQAVHVAPHRRP